MAVSYHVGTGIAGPLEEQPTPAISLASFTDHVYDHISAAALWVGGAQQVAGSELSILYCPRLIQTGNLLWGTEALGKDHCPLLLEQGKKSPCSCDHPWGPQHRTAAPWEMGAAVPRP